MNKIVIDREVTQVVSTEITIPEKPSQLLREVVADMRKIGKLRYVTFDMGHWIRTFNGKSCTVCAAGAWMFSKMGCPKDDLFDIGEIIEEHGNDDTLDYIMCAIDSLRQIDIEDFFYCIEQVYSDAVVWDLDHDLFRACFHAGYNESNPQSVMRAFEKCADVLEAKGL